jgi:hypothetical protein
VLGSLRWLSALWRYAQRWLQSLALALEDVSQRWLLDQRCLLALGSQRLALCTGSQCCGTMLSAGSQSLALALADVSQRWLVAQRCLSALGSQCLVLCAGSQRCGAMLSAGSQSLALAFEYVS